MLNIYFKALNLQLFADEGAPAAESGDTGAGAAATESTETADASGVATEAEAQQAVPAQDTETFESLIKGKYKKEYDAAIKSAINKRFKNQRDLQSLIDSVDPMIKILASKYGIRPGQDGSISIEALNNAIMADDKNLEEEAFKRGMSIEDLREMKRLQAENNTLRNQESISAREQEWQKIETQAAEVSKIYPDFNIETEMNDPNFGRLLATLESSGFPKAVQTAYETIHRDEIMSGAMQYAIGETKNKISKSIQAGTARPTEGGSQSKAGAETRLDPSKLTHEQLEDIKRRAANGERITF